MHVRTSSQAKNTNEVSQGLGTT